MIASNTERVALELLDIGAVRFGSFRLKLHDEHPEAPLSPFYIDLRKIRSVPLLMDSVTELYLQLLRGSKFDAFADVPTAATPIVAVMSFKTGTPMVSPRPNRKEHGVAGNVEGIYKPGQLIALIDDLITKADSKLEAIKLLESCGLIVGKVAVLVDREQGGVHQLQKLGHSCVACFRIRELLLIYQQHGKITTSDHRECLNYLETEGRTFPS